MKILKKLICMSLIVCMCISGSMVTSLAETVLDNVNIVIEKLNNIDTLQQMQNARSNYSDSASYETYKTNMFNDREDAKELYNALTDEEKAMIPDELVLKLDENLDDYWVADYHPTMSRNIYPGDGEYVWQLVNTYRIYEYSNHRNKAGNRAAIMILVDSSTNIGNPWTWQPSPLNDLWKPGISNYELVYCTDMETYTVDGSHYKRTNLEAANYYSDENAKHIRAIVTNSYPFISIDEMKNRLIANGMDKSIVDKLDRADIIAAVQFAIWSYSNNATSDDIEYGKTASISNDSVYHGYSNEIWYWYNTNGGSYVPEVDTRVTALVDYLINLEAKEATLEQIVIDSIIVEEAQAIEDLGDTFNVSLRVKLNGIANDKSDIKLTATTSIDTVEMMLDDSNDYTLNIKAKKGEEINIKVEGTQYLPDGVYLYDPEGGRDTSQSLVGISKGSTKISVEDSTIFNEEIPVKPEDPETPITPDNSVDVVETGDNGLNSIWFIILSISACILLFMTFNKKKIFNK